MIPWALSKRYMISHKWCMTLQTAVTRPNSQLVIRLMLWVLIWWLRYSGCQSCFQYDVVVWVFLFTRNSFKGRLTCLSALMEMFYVVLFFCQCPLPWSATKMYYILICWCVKHLTGDVSPGLISALICYWNLLYIVFSYVVVWTVWLEA